MDKTVRDNFDMQKTRTQGTITIFRARLFCKTVGELRINVGKADSIHGIKSNND